MTHDAPHPLAGKTVALALTPAAGLRDPDPNGELRGQSLVVEDWWDRVGARSWMDETGNPSCLKYAIRSGFGCLPLDDEVVYGKVNGLGHIVHASELGAVQ